MGSSTRTRHGRRRKSAGASGRPPRVRSARTKASGQRGKNRPDRPDTKYEALLAKHEQLRNQYERLLIERKQLLGQLQTSATEQSGASAFATAAMRSPIAGHVYLRDDLILIRNNRFREMVNSSGGPWRSENGAELPTLTEVVRTQSRTLRAPVDVVRYTRADGELVIEVRTERIGDASPLVVATVLDVSAIANAAREAEAARSAAKLEAMQEASRNKDEFLGVLSHELRNPLAPIRTSVYLLDQVDSASEQGRRAREILKRQVGHLARLVDDLLDVTRMERRMFEIRRDPVDLADIVRRTAEDHRGVLQERGVELTVETPTKPVRVMGDDQRIAQVVGNLLHNAAKFTGGGRVTLSVGVQPGAAEVRVRDTGIGMEPDLIEHVFDPFAQARQSLARTAGGLGLGLALVKGVVELHGGTVHASSAGPGRGSEFLLRFPLAKVMSETRQDGAPLATPAPRIGPRRRVLVVEDNVDAASSLADLVMSFGHRVQIAHDGSSALQMARKSRPDVVLCDIGLPGISGYEVAEALRARRDAHPPRLIAVSGYARPDDVKRAMQAGFDAHVAKPCDPEQIERLLS